MQHGVYMQQCLMLMHDDAYDHILVAFNIWDVTTTAWVGLPCGRLGLVGQVDGTLLPAVAAAMGLAC
jgi:hypothetical protein